MLIRKITALNTNRGMLTIDTESGIVTQSTKKIETIGYFPVIQPGVNVIDISGSFKSAKVKLRSVWL